jgi:hypothetical protein
MVVGSIGYNVTQLGESKHSTYFRQIAVMLCCVFKRKSTIEEVILFFFVRWKSTN